MARPTKLTQQILDDARTYLDENSTFMSTMLPTIEGLALYLHVHRDTLYAWRESDEAFSYILEELLQAQAQKLMQNGLQKRYDSGLARLLLSKHGYIEKTEVDNNLSGAVQFVNDVPRPPKD